jgi:hypothetical protein
MLLSKKATSVLAVDRESEAISYASKKYSNHNLKFIQESISSFKTHKGQFDLVVSFETIEHIPCREQGQMIEKIALSLDYNGIFISSTPDTDVYKDNNEFHLCELNKKEYLGKLHKSFKYNVFLGQNIYVNSYIGNHQNGGKLTEYRLSLDGSLEYTPNNYYPNDTFMVALSSNYLLEFNGVNILYDPSNLMTNLSDDRLEFYKNSIEAYKFKLSKRASLHEAYANEKRNNYVDSKNNEDIRRIAQLKRLISCI